MSNIRIYIVGNPNHHNTLSMVRCFGESGYMVDLISIGSEKGCVTKSKYISRISGVTTIDDVVPLLISNAKNSNGKNVVVCCSDEAVCQMDLNYDLLKDDYFFFHTAEKGRLTMLMDKDLQSQLAKEIDFKVPIAKIYSGEIGFKFDCYPCILKPLESIKGGKKIKICYSQNELSHELSQFLEGNRVLIQEYIKREEEFVIVGLSSKDDVLIPAFIRKIRDNNGGTTYCEVNRIERLPPSVLQKCKEMVKRIRYFGLFGIELIYSNNSYYFIEINMRNDATCYAVAKSGVNLPLIYVMDVFGENITKIAKKEIKEIHSMVELKDLKFVLKGKVSPFKWLEQLRNSECKYYFSRDDKKPFFYAIKEVLTRPLHK